MACRIAYLEDNQFQFGDVVGMDPVLGGLTDEVLLGASRRSIALDRVSFGADEIIKFGELYHKGIVVVLEERFCIEARSEDRFKMPTGLFLGAKSAERKTTTTACAQRIG